MNRAPHPMPLPMPPEPPRSLEDILAEHFGIPPVVLRILGMAKAGHPCVCGQCPGAIIEFTTRFHLPHGVIQPLIPGVRVMPAPAHANGEAELGIKPVKVEP